ncbi:MAG TPA: HNH endonuclease signature motif containing protein [Puia sp.]|jgi:hypothetical protein|nr:HNH endonuclease signature motif containing protein [Puia sp.]
MDKGANPTDEHGNPIAVADYDLWRALLIKRIGYYCAYCNMPLSHSLQVEHVVPKDPPAGYTPGDPLAWGNMLLACGPCNRAKWNTPIDFADYYFPEENNTLLAFEIAIDPANTDAALVRPVGQLTPEQLTRARRTIELLKLDVIDRRQKVVDIRWKKRRRAINAVEAVYQLYRQAQHSPDYAATEAARYVAECAEVTGFFGLWFAKFRGEPSVIRELINPAIIPGTDQACFDAANNYSLVPKNPHVAADPI